jgi:hypothetical protein
MIKPVSAHSPVIAAIKRAADKTNNSFDSMLATARAESSLNPAAKAKTSSATGLFQFTKATWLAVAKRHGREAGINPDMPESKLLALRKDPSVAAVMAGFLSNDNRQHLEQRLGRPVSDQEVYVAHFMGASGAARLLSSAESKPLASAANLFPRHAASNRSIFFEGGRARTVAEVTNLLAGKVDHGATTQFQDPRLMMADAANASGESIAEASMPTPRNLGNWMEGDASTLRLMRMNMARKLMQDDPRAAS